MRNTNLVAAIWVGGVAMTLGGCLPSIDDIDNGPLTSTFAVTDYYTPSGYMGDGEKIGLLAATVNQGCKPRPDGARGNCYAFTYHTNPDKTQSLEAAWAGAYWVFPANNWGSYPGHAIDSKVFKQVRFYAAVEGPTPFTFKGAPQLLNALVGNIDPMGFYNSIGLEDHKDALSATTAAQPGLDIGPDLKQFHIPLTDFAKMSCRRGAACDDQGFANDLIAAFGWSVHYPSDQDPDKTGFIKIYFDDIVWDTEAPPP